MTRPSGKALLYQLLFPFSALGDFVVKSIGFLSCVPSAAKRQQPTSLFCRLGLMLACLVLLAAGGTNACAQTASFSNAIQVLGSGFNTPSGVAVDSNGNVFVADTQNGLVKEIPYSAGSYGTPVPLGSGFVSPRGVAVDASGNVFVTDIYNNTVKKIPYSGGSYGTPVPLASTIPLVWRWTASATSSSPMPTITR